MVRAQKKLAITLSNLVPHPCENAELEQYSIDGELAARWLMDIVAFGDLREGCTVADLGCGNGILSVGALLLGAGKAIAVDADSSVVDVAKSNLKGEGFWQQGEWIHATIGDDEINLSGVDLVITNPPWGRQKEKADRPFLQEILDCRVTAHILHSASATHIEPLFTSAGWDVEKYGEADFVLPANYSHHTSTQDKTRVAFWRLTPNS